MGYAAVIKQIVEIWDCPYKEAQSIFGRMGYNACVRNVMREENMSTDDARSHIGLLGYTAITTAIMGFFCCSKKDAQFIFASRVVTLG